MFSDRKGMAAIAIFAIVALLGVVVMFSGANNGATGFATACVQDRPDCKIGKFCDAGKCVAGCRDGAPCASSKACINNKCVPPPTTCQDSDGLDQFVSGSTQLFKSDAPKGNPKADVCKQGKPATPVKPQTFAKLTEYTCSPPDAKGNQKIVPNKITCPDFACNGNGCHQPGTAAQFPDNNACVSSAECASASCINGKCGVLRENGKFCTADAQCTSGFCGEIIVSGTKQKVCLRKNLPDASSCIRGTECTSGSCVPVATVAGSTPQATAGNTVCGQPHNHQELCITTDANQCSPGLYCLTDASASPTGIYGRCHFLVKSRSNGETCDLSLECLSNRCSAGFCRIVSGPCTTNNECVSGICRVDHTCAPNPSTNSTN